MSRLAVAISAALVALSTAQASAASQTVLRTYALGCHVVALSPKTGTATIRLSNHHGRAFQTGKTVEIFLLSRYGRTPIALRRVTLQRGLMTNGTVVFEVKASAQTGRFCKASVQARIEPTGPARKTPGPNDSVRR